MLFVSNPDPLLSLVFRETATGGKTTVCREGRTVFDHSWFDLMFNRHNAYQPVLCKCEDIRAQRAPQYNVLQTNRTCTLVVFDAESVSTITKLNEHPSAYEALVGMIESVVSKRDDR